MRKSSTRGQCFPDEHGMLPTSGDRQPDAGSRPSIVVSVSEVRKVCHGSRVVVEQPRIIQTRYTKDFGPGFYCTVLREQAMRWAVRFTGRGWLSHFDYRPDPSLDTLVFPQMSEEWLDFVVACRHGDAHAHDIVEGPMANDTIYNYVQDFIDGKISRAAFWELAKFKRPTHQICFCTAAALGTLTFSVAEEVYDG